MSVAAAVVLTLPSLATAQEPPAELPRAAAAAAEFDGLTVRDIDVEGNDRVPDEQILNLLRTRVGQPFDHETIFEDYRQIDAQRRFSNVEATVTPTADGQGVTVTFFLAEQRPIESVAFVGNTSFTDERLRDVAGIRVGEAVDPFRVALARQAIEAVYAGRNFPLTRISVDVEAATETGELVFEINEGPNVKVRNIDFLGNDSFSEDALKKRIATKTYIPILRPGTFSEEAVDDDVAALANYYQSKGFFDAKVGRRLKFSPDQADVQVEFVIDEGPRYVVDRVTFEGNERLSDEQLREALKMTEGVAYDQTVVQRDVRRMVGLYSPLGLLYDPQSRSPDYLRIDAAPVFRLEPGKLELRYQINEGNEYRVGDILVRGNAQTQDKVALRELRLAPGDVYDSDKLLVAQDRLRGLAAFDAVSITPIGDDPDSRDLVVDVTEGQTGFLSFGAGIDSNGGLGGNITFVQRNFDASDLPDSFGEFAQGKAFVGAGQTFRASFEPGNESTNASVLLTEPYLFDQPYSLTLEAYVRDRRRLEFGIRRSGGRVTLGRFLDDERIWSLSGTLRVEDVQVDDIVDEELRSFQILAAEGSTTLASVGAQLRRSTVNNRFLPTGGSVGVIGWEGFGLLGIGADEFEFHRFIGTYDVYYSLSEDLRDRPTTLRFGLDAGYIVDEAPVFEKFYEGGIGSIRGFAFRGVTVRDGPADDRVGGDFTFTGTAEVGFPISGDNLRGVVFTDFGSVTDDFFDVSPWRQSVGAGVRVNLPVFGQAPLAVDFAVPLVEGDEDDRRLISFNLGIVP